MPDTENAAATEPAATEGDWLGDALTEAHAKVTAADKPETTETRDEPAGDRPDRARDESGRFAKKAETDAPEAEKPPAETTADQTPTQEAKPAETPGLEPPAAWSGAAKAKWATLPPDIQQEVLKREGDVAKGFDAKAKENRRYADLEQVIAPMRDKWAMRGASEVQAISGLIHTAELVERDPARGLALLAQHYGVNLAQLAQSPQAEPDPVQGALRPVLEEVNALKQQLAAQTTASVTSELHAFKADTKNNPHFEAVRADMGQLMQAGLANTLQDAYDQAIWRNPEVRQRILADQRADEDRKRTEANAKAAADARKAIAVNVRGRTGASPASPQSWQQTLEDVGKRAASRA